MSEHIKLSLVVVLLFCGNLISLGEQKVYTITSSFVWEQDTISSMGNSRWDIVDDVNPTNIVLPDSVVLHFISGAFVGAYSVKGNQTSIKVDSLRDSSNFIFSEVGQFSGDWSNTEVYINWFQKDSLVNDAIRINNAAKLLGYGGTLFLDSLEYVIQRTTEVGDYNAGIVIPNKSFVLNGRGATLRADSLSNCIVLRCGELRSGVNEIVLLKNLSVNGNWDEQTWVGPMGGESQDVYDQNGIYFFAYDTVRCENVHLYDVAQDGMSGGSNGYVYFKNCSVSNTGKGGASQFFTSKYIVENCTFSNPNNSPSVDKTHYTTSTEGYSCVGLAYSKEDVENELVLKNCTLTISHTLDRGTGVSLINDAKVLSMDSCTIDMNGGTNAIKLGGTSHSTKLNLENTNIQSTTSSRTVNVVGTDSVYINNSQVNDHFFIQCNHSNAVSCSTNLLRIYGGRKAILKNSDFNTVKIEKALDTLIIDQSNIGNIINKSLVKEIIEYK